MKTGLNSDHNGLKSGMVLKGTTRAYELIWGGGKIPLSYSAKTHSKAIEKNILLLSINLISNINVSEHYR